MSRFSDLTITWRGKDYTVKAKDMLGLIAQVEEIITLPEIDRAARRFQKGKLSMAYGAMLRYAGCHVDDDEVHDEMFRMEDGEQRTMTEAIEFLYRVVTPPSWMEEKKSEPVKKKATKKKSARKGS